jgi:ArsR family transcriptional regulator
MDLVDVFKALSNNNKLPHILWLKEPDKYFPNHKLTVEQNKFGVCAGHIQKTDFTQPTISSHFPVL